MSDTSNPLKTLIHRGLPPDAELPKNTHFLDQQQRRELPDYYAPEEAIWAIPKPLLDAIDNPALMYLMPMAQRLFLWSFIYGVCPKRYLEIGTAEGGSAMIVMSAIKALGFEDFQGICIDPKFDITSETKQALANNFTFFEEISSLDVMKKAKTQVGGFFDVLLVDGDHTYDYALADIILAIPFVQPGGYILVDDAGYYQVRDAIQYAVERFNLIDAGFMCRHITPYKKHHVIEKDGPWQGEDPFMSGLHVLRKPL
jgi:predicted O-methyltransferase YrrM